MNCTQTACLKQMPSSRTQSQCFVLFSQAKKVGETGLLVGQPKCTTLGDSSKGKEPLALCVRLLYLQPCVFR